MKPAPGNSSLNRTRGRTYFTEEELAEGANVAIISESAEYRASGGTLRLGEDTIHVNGVDFTVIGVDIIGNVTSLSPPLPMRKTDFRRLRIRDDGETAVLLRKPRAAAGYAGAVPRVSVGGHPYSAMSNSKQDTPSVLLVLAIVFVAAISAFMFLLKYLSDGTNYISAIQSVCGAPKDTVVFIKLASVFLLTFSVSAAGVALHGAAV